MITITKPVDLPDTYPIERIGTKSKLLFFDIETTGFSGDYSRLYLIGCTYYEHETWNLIQWFADTSDSEEEMLHAFFQFLQSYETLVHFNGDGFDLPYLLKRCHYYKLPYDFSKVESFDLYKKIKPYRLLLGLDSLKQKSIERFLGIHRTDLYNGGQLIEVYHEYLAAKETRLYHLLILHNEEDLTGMPLILPILNYPDFWEQPFSLKEQEFFKDGAENDEAACCLNLVCQSKNRIPVPFQIKTNLMNCRASDDTLALSIPLMQGELKYFYPNYKDYYYLTFEDTAIHKSVGEYVDRAAKTKATAKTCYTKRAGLFLPQPEEIWSPAFRIAYKDKVSFIEYQPDFFMENQKFQEYLSLCLRHTIRFRPSALNNPRM